MSLENPHAIHDPATCYDCGAKNNESRHVRWQTLREIETKKASEIFAGNPLADPDELSPGKVGERNVPDYEALWEQVEPFLYHLWPLEQQVILSIHEGKTHQVIADELGIARPTVTIAANRAVKKLRRLLRR